MSSSKGNGKGGKGGKGGKKSSPSSKKSGKRNEKVFYWAKNGKSKSVFVIMFVHSLSEIEKTKVLVSFDSKFCLILV